MVVDYHVHLEPDSHAGRCKYTLGNLDDYVHHARLAGVDEIGITEHCNRFVQFLPAFKAVMDRDESIPAITQWIRDGCTEDLEEYVGFLRKAQDLGYPIKASIEVDFIPEEAEAIAAILNQYEFDYVLGSVHFVGSWAVDYSREIGWPTRSVDGVFRQYFEVIEEAIRSKLFDCIAHPDLVKKFGFHPGFDLRPTFERIAVAMNECDVAYEVSTAGLFKPVGEIYPSPLFVEVMYSHGVPLVLSSDAHCPQEVGREFDRSMGLVRAAGYRQIAVFDDRIRSMRPLPVD